jgi:hypothetical protein
MTKFVKAHKTNLDKAYTIKSEKKTSEIKIIKCYQKVRNKKKQEGLTEIEYKNESGGTFILKAIFKPVHEENLSPKKAIEKIDLSKPEVEKLPYLIIYNDKIVIKLSPNKLRGDEAPEELPGEYNTYYKYKYLKPYDKETELELTVYDYNRLNGDNYLNENIVFFFLKFLDDNFNKNKIKLFNTIIFTILKNGDNGRFDEKMINYNKLRRNKWLNLYNNDAVIFPVVYQGHWTLVLITNLKYMKNLYLEEFNNPNELPIIIYLDSLFRDLMTIPNLFKKFIIYDYAMKNNVFDTENQLIQFMSNNHEKVRIYYPIVPSQTNFYDCGIYLLMYAQLFLHDPEYLYTKATQDNPDLKEWFNYDLIKDKRKEIKELIKQMKHSTEAHKVVIDYRKRMDDLLSKYYNKNYV